MEIWMSAREKSKDEQAKAEREGVQSRTPKGRLQFLEGKISRCKLFEFETLYLSRIPTNKATVDTTPGDNIVKR